MITQTLYTIQNVFFGEKRGRARADNKTIYSAHFICDYDHERLSCIFVHVFGNHLNLWKSFCNCYTEVCRHIPISDGNSNYFCANSFVRINMENLFRRFRQTFFRIDTQNDLPFRTENMAFHCNSRNNYLEWQVIWKKRKKRFNNMHIIWAFIKLWKKNIFVGNIPRFC